ncbi:TBC1 domain family member 16 [Aphelenchoides fujianensis]|nr:TBC1 domain family member 16 [Aphelenchoides fujianensis]
MHMDAKVVLKKARGLLFHFFHRLERIPCTLAGVCELDSTAEQQWTSHVQPVFECTKIHGVNNQQCPFAVQN